VRIGLISNLGPGASFDKLLGYNQVMAWYLARELGAILIPDTYLLEQDLAELPAVDVAIAISSTAIVRLRQRGEDAAVIPCQRLCWLSDGPVRSIIPWGKASTADGAYIGMGVDPEVCYPEQDDIPTVLVNAWNATLDRADLEDPAFLHQMKTASRLDREGIRVLGLNCKAPGSTWVGRELKDTSRVRADVGTGQNTEPAPLPGPKLGYVLWKDICAAYRRGWVFLDGTPKVIELGRVEAAACGNALFTLPHVADEIDGIRFLPQVNWKASPEQDVGTTVGQILRTLDKTRPEDFQARADRVLEYFNWPAVASRLLAFLEAK